MNGRSLLVFVPIIWFQGPNVASPSLEEHERMKEKKIGNVIIGSQNL